jgi:amino acid adenylation domain-containing protein
MSLTLKHPGAAAPADVQRPAWLADSALPLDWNGPRERTFVRFRDDDMDVSIVDHFHRVALWHPDRVALMDGETALTYRELSDGVSGLAETITARTAPGDLVGILLPACPMFPLAMLACLAAGRPFVALDPHYPRDWLDKVLEDARPALVISQKTLLRGIEALAGANVIHLDGPPKPASKDWRPVALGLDDPACVLFTSGSSGRPKGIVNSQRNLLQRVAQSINAGHINTEDRFLTLASLCTIVGVRDVMTALLAGASVRLIDPQRAGVREIHAVIRTDAVTILFAFPALLRSVLASSAEQASCMLRLVRIGGDTTLWSDIDMLRGWLAPSADIQLIYAATEAPMMQWYVDDAFRGSDPRIPIGYPLPGNRLAVIGDDGLSAPPGECGELVVQSPYVSLGFWAKGGFVGAESNQSSARIFRTGDIVRQRPDGLLERFGRKDRQVKIRGSRIDLDGVEAALRQHAFVEDAGAVARTSGPENAATLVAYVSARRGAPAGLLDELKVMMQAAPAAMRPSHLFLVDRIPRLPSSKLDATALMLLDAANDRSDRASAASQLIEADRIGRTVAQVWQDLLHASVGSREDDFFEAGGDSLKALTFTLEVEQALGIELPVTLINEAPTFGAFCDALRENRAAAYTPLVVLKPGASLPPVFFVHGVGGNVTEILPTARRLNYAGPVIGIQARGLTGTERPHAGVEAMATDYLKEIKARQPNGPYCLCGYSFGGLVAFEIAKRLRAAGDEIALVGLFDTMMSPVKWPLRAWLLLAWRRILRFVAGDSPPPPSPAATRNPRALKVASSALLASARYRTGYYDGALTLFSPADRDAGLPSLDTIWRKHAHILIIVETDGTHATMLSPPNADSTAKTLARYLPSVGNSARPNPDRGQG